MLSSKSQILSRLLNTLMWVLGLLVSILYLFHFQNTNNDFQVFMKAGKYFLERENPWDKFTDPNAMYLNGSGTIFLSSLLSLIPINYGLLLLRIFNILAVLTISFLISHKSPRLPAPSVFILILLIFPFRSAMEYGQFTVLFTFLAFLLLSNVMKKESDSVLAIFSLALIVDFKPHIFVGLFVIILLRKRFSLVLKAFGAWLMIQLITGWWSHTFPVFEWYLAVKRRSDFVSDGEDNLSLVSHFGSFQNLLAILLSIIGILYIWRRFRNSSGTNIAFVEIIVIGLILSPLLHPTDLLLVALLLISQFDFSILNSLLIGLFLVWSPLPSGAIFTLVIITFWFVLLSIQNGSLGKVNYLALIASYLGYLFVLRVGIYEVSVRHFLQQSILIIIAVRSLKINQKVLQRV